MDLTIPLILGLQIGGNVSLFWGMFRIIKVKCGGEGETEEVDDLGEEITSLSKQIRRM
jgi:hypothetical protein